MADVETRCEGPVPEVTEENPRFDLFDSKTNLAELRKVPQEHIHRTGGKGHTYPGRILRFKPQKVSALQKPPKKPTLFFVKRAFLPLFPDCNSCGAPHDFVLFGQNRPSTHADLRKIQGTELQEPRVKL